MAAARRTQRPATSGATPLTTADTTAPAGIPKNYQPALDGVRAIAVGLVMLFHMALAEGMPIVGGGWLGVDVFFVLSGYLITSLLLTERDRHGTNSLKNFYVRRFLRLAPLSVALVLLIWLGTALGSNDAFGIHLSFSGGVAILGYYSNWWEIARPGGLGSLGHAWSLSIEEQFYFVWPWIVVGAFAVAKRSARTVLTIFTAVTVIALGLIRRRFWLASTGPDVIGDDIVAAWLVFFRNSFLRADSLVYGCLLALVLHKVTSSPGLRRALAACAIPALVVIGLIIGFTHFKLWQPWVPFIPLWGLSVFNIAVTTVIAWLVIAPRSWFARVLSLRALTWVGRRAYGIYLLHPLVLDVVTARTSLTSFPLETVASAATLIVAGVSFRFLETPFLRLKERFSSR